MKFGDIATLAPDSVDRKGRGVGTIGTRRAAAPFLIPGEEAEVSLRKRDGSQLITKVETLTKASPHRIAPPCRYAGTCGGCAWQQFDYAWQLETKAEHINAALSATGIEQRIAAVTPAPEQFNYRNRMDYCIGWKGELGLKEPGSWNRYLNLEECHLLSPDAVKLMSAFREWMTMFHVEPWNSRGFTGYARYLVIREGKRTGKRMATVITAAGELPAARELVEVLSPFATTIYHGINPTQTDLSIASELHLLHGEELLTEEVCGKTFFIHPNAFFQTNTVMAEKLVEKVREYLAPQPPKTLLDLYCGTGLFGICLAETAERVVGIEIEESAIVMARRNADANGVTNATFAAAKAESLIWETEQPDTVIVDPPRAGLHPKVIETLLAQAPERIAYVSCNFESFARDFKMLSEKYEIVRMDAFDLFPHSPHVELAALLVRK